MAALRKISFSLKIFQPWNMATNRNVFELRFLLGVYERKPILRKIVPRQLVSAQVFLSNLGKLRFKNIPQCFAFETPSIFLTKIALQRANTSIP